MTVKHPLSRALHGAGLGLIDVAAQLRVDPKTVQRWLAGRVPYPRHRAALCRLTGWPEPDLWPHLAGPLGPDLPTGEVQAVYPHRSNIPADTWRRFFTRARRAIDIIADDCLFLAQDPAIRRLLGEAARAGVRVRITLADPDASRLVQRVSDGGGDHGTASSIRAALDLLQPLAAEAGVQVRLHDTVLYHGIYRTDHQLLVNSYTYGLPAARSPVLHLRHLHDDGVSAIYRLSIERIWNTARVS